MKKIRLPKPSRKKEAINEVILKDIKKDSCVKKRKS